MGVEDSAYETHEAPTGAGDAVVLYTDGLIERRGESLDVGLERLADAASAGPEDRRRCASTSSSELLEPPEQRYDDVTAVVARLPG